MAFLQQVGSSSWLPPGPVVPNEGLPIGTPVPLQGGPFIGLQQPPRQYQQPPLVAGASSGLTVTGSLSVINGMTRVHSSERQGFAISPRIPAESSSKQCKSRDRSPERQAQIDSGELGSSRRAPCNVKRQASLPQSCERQVQIASGELGSSRVALCNVQRQASLPQSWRLLKVETRSQQVGKGAGGNARILANRRAPEPSVGISRDDLDLKTGLPMGRFFMDKAISKLQAEKPNSAAPSLGTRSTDSLHQSYSPHRWQLCTRNVLTALVAAGERWVLRAIFNCWPTPKVSSSSWRASFIVFSAWKRIIDKQCRAQMLKREKEQAVEHDLALKERAAEHDLAIERLMERDAEIANAVTQAALEASLARTAESARETQAALAAELGDALQRAEQGRSTQAFGFTELQRALQRAEHSEQMEASEARQARAALVDYIAAVRHDAKAIKGSEAVSAAHWALETAELATAAAEAEASRCAEVSKGVEALELAEASARAAEATELRAAANEMQLKKHIEILKETAKENVAQELELKKRIAELEERGDVAQKRIAELAEQAAKENAAQELELKKRMAVAELAEKAAKENAAQELELKKRIAELEEREDVAQKRIADLEERDDVAQKVVAESQRCAKLAAQAAQARIDELLLRVEVADGRTEAAQIHAEASELSVHEERHSLTHQHFRQRDMAEMRSMQKQEADLDELEKRLAQKHATVLRATEMRLKQIHAAELAEFEARLKHEHAARLQEAEKNQNEDFAARERAHTAEIEDIRQRHAAELQATETHLTSKHAAELQATQTILTRDRVVSFHELETRLSSKHSAELEEANTSISNKHAAELEEAKVRMQEAEKSSDMIVRRTQIVQETADSALIRAAEAEKRAAAAKNLHDSALMRATNAEQRAAAAEKKNDAARFALYVLMSNTSSQMNLKVAFTTWHQGTAAQSLAKSRRKQKKLFTYVSNARQQGATWTRLHWAFSAWRMQATPWQGELNDLLQSKRWVLLPRLLDSEIDAERRRCQTVVVSTCYAQCLSIQLWALMAWKQSMAHITQTVHHRKSLAASHAHIQHVERSRHDVLLLHVTLIAWRRSGQHQRGAARCILKSRAQQSHTVLQSVILSWQKFVRQHQKLSSLVSTWSTQRLARLKRIILYVWRDSQKQRRNRSDLCCRHIDKHQEFWGRICMSSWRDVVRGQQRVLKGLNSMWRAQGLALLRFAFKLWPAPGLGKRPEVLSAGLENLATSELHNARANNDKKLVVDARSNLTREISNSSLSSVPPESSINLQDLCANFEKQTVDAARRFAVKSQALMRASSQERNNAIGAGSSEATLPRACAAAEVLTARSEEGMKFPVTPPTYTQETDPPAAFLGSVSSASLASESFMQTKNAEANAHTIEMNQIMAQRKSTSWPSDSPQPSPVYPPQVAVYPKAGRAGTPNRLSVAARNETESTPIRSAVRSSYSSAVRRTSPTSLAKRTPRAASASSRGSIRHDLETQSSPVRARSSIRQRRPSNTGSTGSGSRVPSQVHKNSPRRSLSQERAPQDTQQASAQNPGDLQELTREFETVLGNLAGAMGRHLSQQANAQRS